MSWKNVKEEVKFLLKTEFVVCTIKLIFLVCAGFVAFTIAHLVKLL